MRSIKGVTKSGVTLAAGADCRRNTTRIVEIPAGDRAARKSRKSQDENPLLLPARNDAVFDIRPMMIAVPLRRR
jgi:hypothetical protein